MAENLAYKPISGNYWAYDNKQNNISKYGYLYDWEAAKRACPNGWHLPSDEEWTTLTDYLGGENIAGGKLKSTGSWSSQNTVAINASGFSALPAGKRYSDGLFYFVGKLGYFWSSTPKTEENAWVRRLDYDNNRVSCDSGNRACGFSIRCLKN